MTVKQNAGRCDTCGTIIDMSEGDRLEMYEYEAPDAFRQEYGTTDQEAANTVADALEAVGDSGASYERARVNRTLARHTIVYHPSIDSILLCLSQSTV